jgi:5-methylcytosine-specific restriction protein A
MRRGRYLHIPGTGRPTKMQGADDPRYRSYAWKQLRAKVIAERQCEGRCGGIFPVKYVDHIKEVRDGGEFFDPANLQALCAPDHALKTAEEKDKRLGKKHTVRYLRGCDVDGDPIDPNHPWNRE